LKSKKRKLREGKIRVGGGKRYMVGGGSYCVKEGEGELKRSSYGSDHRGHLHELRRINTRGK